MDIDNAVCTCRETPLDQLVVGVDVGAVQSPTKNIVDEILPPNRQTEDVEFIILRDACRDVNVSKA